MSNLAMMMGLGSAAGGVNVADVFSTDLYTSDGNNRDVVNGLDLAGEGGLVWFKIRNLSGDHALFDTERGALKVLSTNATSAESTQASSLTAFNSNGYSIGTSGYVNYSSGYNYVSWAWRKAPKFFDVIHYDGNGVSGRAIDHNLNSDVGMIIVKSTTLSGTSWRVFHRSLGATQVMRLNTTDSATTSSSYWADTEPTSTQFTIGNVNDMNNASYKYVAYLFAHNEDLIQCGSFNGDPSGSLDVTLGFQPQFIIVKTSNAAGNFTIFDAERGAGKYFVTDGSTAEGTDASPDITFTASGFTASGNFGIDGRSYIYMAIKAED